MARPRSPRGGKNGVMLGVRLSVAEKKHLIERAYYAGVTLAKLQRDRLLHDMPGYRK